MKTIIFRTVCAVLSIVCIFLFTGCNIVNDEHSQQAHEHIYNDKLSFDSTHHFKVCVDKSCGCYKDKEIHAFQEPIITRTPDKITKTYKCLFCDYEKKETEPNVFAGVDEKAWKQAFQNVAMDRLKVNIFTNDQFYREVIITKNSACMIDGVGKYTKEIENGVFVVYDKPHNTATWKKYFDNGEQYNSIKQDMRFLPLDFSQSYSQFTYNQLEDNYEAKTATLDNGYGTKGVVTECVIKILNEKINYVKYTWQESEGHNRTFIVSDIGNADFIIPQEVIDNAQTVPTE